MRPLATSLLAVNGVLLLVGLGWAARLWQTGAALRTDSVQLRARADEMVRLRAENEGLAARLVSDAELERLRADHAALDRLRSELAGMNQRAQERIRAPVVPPTVPEAPPGAGPVRRVRECTDAGRSAPDAAFETVVWAASGGRIDALVPLLIIESEGWNAIKAALADLPDTERRKYWPPARFVATALAKDLALTSYQVLSRDEAGPNAVALTTQMHHADNTTSETRFIVYQEKEKGDWKLIVPRDATLRYVGLWTGALPSAAGAGK